MKEGDMVLIDYIARIKDTGEVFDTTKEEVAKQAGIFDSNYKYRPLPVLIGAGFVIKGLEEALKNMEVGQSKKIEIPPEKAYGERDERLVKLIPESNFRDNNIEPIVGKYVQINNLTGKIVSVSGGRVKVDFNHPLAGKVVEYEVSVVKKVEDEAEKAKEIVYFFTNLEDVEASIVKENNEKIAQLKLKVDLTPNAKSLITETIKKWLSCQKVRFVIEF